MVTRNICKWAFQAFSLGVLAAGYFVAGCGNSDGNTFQAIEKHIEAIADFEDLDLGGQERLVFTAQVTDDMIHPEFIADWTNLNSEVDVDFFVLRTEDYDPDINPESLQNIFFTSAPDSGKAIFGERRVTNAHIHPGVGSWVLFFFNQAGPGNPLNISELSANVDLVFHR